MRQLKVLDSIKSVSIADENLLVNVEGVQVPVEVVGNSLVSEALTIFSCRPTEETKADFPSPTSIIVLGDSLEAEDFRRLRVYLKGLALD